MEEKENNSSGQGDENKDKKKALTWSDQTRLEKEILNDLDTNPRYAEFLDRYSAISAKFFKDHFAHTKAEILINGARLLENEEYRVLRYSSMAEEYLWHIQQRKLFDLQCRWRADQIKINGIEISADFKEWSENIEECTFLTPITQDEFDLYMTFISTGKMEDIKTDYLTVWQEYESFKSQYMEPDDDDYVYQTPGWYEFYENTTGLGSLYLLDDVRGEKEEFYMEISRNYDNKKNDEKNADKPKPVIDQRPYMDYTNDEVILEFLKKYEDGNFIIKWQAYNNSFATEEDEMVDDALETLRSAVELCPINFNDSWRAGIIFAADEYIRKKLLEELPKAYNDYMFRVKSCLGFNKHFEKRYSHHASFEKEIILRGRELNGEPRNFNF